MSLSQWNAQRVADSLPTSSSLDQFVQMVESEEAADIDIAPLRLPHSDAALMRPLKRLAPQLYAKLEAKADVPREQLQPVLTDIANASRILVSDAEYLLRCRKVRNKSAEALCESLMSHVDKLMSAAATDSPAKIATELNSLLDCATSLSDAALMRSPPHQAPSTPAPNVESRGRIQTSPRSPSRTSQRTPTVPQADLPTQLPPMVNMQEPAQMAPQATAKAEETQLALDPVDRRVSTVPVPGAWAPSVDESHEKRSSHASPTAIAAADLPPRLPGHLSVHDSRSVLVWPDVPVEDVSIAPSVAATNVGTVNSNLLSTVAALIGFVHTHQSSNASSSYQYLVDNVHSTLNHVRYILAHITALHEPKAKASVPESRLNELVQSGEGFLDAAISLYHSTRLLESQDDEECRTTVMDKVSPLLIAGNTCVVVVQSALQSLPSTISLPLQVPSVIHRACAPASRPNDTSDSPKTQSDCSSISSNPQREATHYKTGSHASIRTEATSESCANSVNSGADTEFDTASSIHSFTDPNISADDPEQVALADRFSRFLWTSRDDDPEIQPAYEEQEGDITNTTLQAPITPMVQSAQLPELETLAAPRANRHVIRNNEGRIIGGTLDGIVECMVLCDSAVDAAFVRSFFLCFRMFSTPTDLRRSMVSIFCDAKQYADPDSVRLRTLQLLRIWIEHHWHAKHDHSELGHLANFVNAAYSPNVERIIRTLQSLLRRRDRLGNGVQNVVLETDEDGDRLRLRRLLKTPAGETISLTLSGNDALPDNLGDTRKMYTYLGNARETPAPPPTNVSKSLLAMLRANENTPLRVNVLEFDPMELARQITIMESRIYCGILPDEILFRSTPYYAGPDANGPFAAAPHVRSMSAVTTHLTNWIGECILSELNLRRRAQILKFFVRLGSASIALQNYNLLMAIQSALNSSTISRLKRTWRALPAKISAAADHQRRLVEHHRNFSAYRAKLRAAVGPAIPFLGFVLTDETFCRAGNPATRDGVINMVRYLKIGRIISEMQHFQQPYNLVMVIEIQAFLCELFRTLSNVRSTNSNPQAGDELYRRSLMLEPRKEPSRRKGSIASIASVILPESSTPS
ncbi:Ras guanine nucleotide exchange factor bud5 [Malassezia cuniculi]|uniref:Ras guanine nucleotide exchange factor bud5 n=1 Tax=Malassezia cuniculi TaxID=948313 RepID=A0AAF0EX04_9BASI|nr:Ras guanine nucleotide exchange factor bud5 [Malassezia cuniculi]